MLYIIDRHTGQTNTAVNPANYTLNYDVTLLASSTFETTAGVNVGDILYLDDCNYFGIVSAIGVRQFDAKPLYSILDRKLAKPTGIVNGYTQELKRIIDANLISSSDTFLNYPITTENAYTYGAEVYNYIANSDGLVNMLDVYRDMFAQNRTVIAFQMTTNGVKLVLNNARENSTLKVVDLSTLNITSEEQQTEYVGKVVAKNTASGVVTTHYAYTDGSTSTSASVSGKTRLYGRTEYVFGATDAEVTQSAHSSINENTFSHLIEFEAPGDIFGQSLDVYDLVRIKGKGDVVYSSYISAVSKTKNSRLIKYKTGDLRVTLTDKIRRLVK